LAVFLRRLLDQDQRGRPLMARTRNLKPGFFKNDDLSELDPFARLLFAGLWTIADRDGRLEDRPKIIKAEILPHDQVDTEALLSQLADRGLIRRYSAGGKKCIDIPKFLKHQNPHKKEVPSELASFDRSIAEEKPEQAQEIPDLGSTQTGTSPAFFFPPSPNLLPLSSAQAAEVAEAEPDAIELPKPKAVTLADCKFPTSLDNAECRIAFGDWLAHRKTKRAPYTDAEYVNRHVLEPFARDGPQIFIASIRDSIGNKYQKLVAVKDFRNAKSNPSRVHGNDHEFGEKPFRQSEGNPT
jgi:hypothetical protein